MMAGGKVNGGDGRWSAVRAGQMKSYHHSDITHDSAFPFVNAARAAVLHSAGVRCGHWTRATPCYVQPVQRHAEANPLIAPHETAEVWLPRATYSRPGWSVLQDREDRRAGGGYVGRKGQRRQSLPCSASAVPQPLPAPRPQKHQAAPLTVGRGGRRVTCREEGTGPPTQQVSVGVNKRVCSILRLARACLCAAHAALKPPQQASMPAGRTGGCRRVAWARRRVPCSARRRQARA